MKTKLQKNNKGSDSVKVADGGWEVKKLGDKNIFSVDYGTRVVKKRDGGSRYDVYGGGGKTFFMDECNRADSLVVARFAMSEKCTRFVKGKFFLNDSGLTVSIVNKKHINQNYLNYYFIFLNNYIYSLGRGSAQRNLDLKKFREIKISYPKSVTEQKRIVKILDGAFADIEKARGVAEKNLENIKELFESYLRNLFANQKWEKRTLGEIAIFRNGINFTKGSKGEEIKIVGVRDFQNSFWVSFESLDSVIIDGELGEIDFLKKGDILTVRSNGNPELIGRTLLTGEVTGKVSHSGFTIRIRLNSKDIYPIYLCCYLKSQKARKELVASGTGVNIKSLNQQALTSLVVPVPSFSEQKEIVKKLDKLSKKVKEGEAIFRRKIVVLDELKKSLLKKAFNGEL